VLRGKRAGSAGLSFFCSAPDLLTYYFLDIQERSKIRVTRQSEIAHRPLPIIIISSGEGSGLESPV
jgi:hypothetical protein